MNAPFTTAKVDAPRPFAVGDMVADHFIRGKVIQLDSDKERGLVLVEYEVWAGEPLRSEWMNPDRLRLDVPQSAEKQRAA